MASLPFATVAQLAAWVGEDIPANDPRASAVLTAASVLIRSEVGTKVAEEWAEAPADVAMVVTQVAARVWFNPQGLAGDSIDDYSRRWESVQESGVYLTKGERDILSPYRGKPKGVWTLGTTRGDDYVDQYLDVINASDGHSQEQMPFLPPGV